MRLGIKRYAQSDDKERKRESRLVIKCTSIKAQGRKELNRRQKEEVGRKMKNKARKNASIRN